MRPLAILLCVPLLAGCVQDASGDDDAGPDESTQYARVLIDYGDIRDDEPSETEVPFDPDARPTQADYNETGTPRPDAYTVHDLTLDWSRTTGTPVTIEHHAATGYSVTAIDGVTANTTPGGRWYWALHVDGQPATGGMGTVVVEDGSEYLWKFTHATD